MPYHLSEDGKVVLGEDNKPVPGGQHDTHADALAHMQAMNINVHDVDAPPPKDGEKTAAVGAAAGEQPTAADLGTEKQITAPAAPVAAQGTPNRPNTCLQLCHDTAH